MGYQGIHQRLSPAGRNFRRLGRRPVHDSKAFQTLERLWPARTVRRLPTVCTTEPYGAHDAPQINQMARLLHPHPPEGLHQWGILAFGYTFLK